MEQNDNDWQNKPLLKKRNDYDQFEDWKWQLCSGYKLQNLSVHIVFTVLQRKLNLSEAPQTPVQ